jgi:peptidoglycan-associated lipoprotein
MYRHIFFLTIVLSVLLLGGCAAKRTDSTAAASPAAAEVSHPPVNPADSDVEQQPVATPPSATITTLDGKTLEVVYFEYDSFILLPSARQALQGHAAWLQANPAVRVTVEGHCDERGADEYNLALGERRALAVKNYLVTLGIAGDRLATISYGEERPAVAGQGEAAWARNRRAEFK